MELPKLVYDDFYKFLMSFGTILIVASGAGIFISADPLIWFGFLIGFIVTFCLGILIMLLAGRKWYNNQKITDDLLQKEAKLKELKIEREEFELKQLKNTTQIVVPEQVKERVAVSPSLSPSTSPSFSPSPSPSLSAEDLSQKVLNRTPRVSYQIASVLPNSVSFNFIEVHKVWFWIFNYDPNKYLAYIKIKFITEDFKEESISEYYGGLKAWKLNGYSGIQAPGLGFPKQIKEAVVLGKRVSLEINCKIHDEFNNLIEEKLPQTYSYNPDGNYWFLEP